MGRREKMPVIPPGGEVPLGAKIRARRWHQGISLSQLASAVGNYDQSHLSHIENGRDVPPPDLLETIAQALDIAVDEIKAATAEQVQGWLDSRLQMAGADQQPPHDASIGGGRTAAALPHPADPGPTDETVAGSVSVTVAASPDAPDPMVLEPVEAVAAPAPAPALNAAPPVTEDTPPTHAATMIKDAATTGDTPTELTPDVLAQIAAMLSASIEELEGVTEAELVAWLDDPALFEAERVSGRLPRARQQLSDDGPAALANAASGATESLLPDATEEAGADGLTSDVLAQVAEMLGATIEELEGVSEAQLVAWLDDPAAFAAARAAAVLPPTHLPTAAPTDAPAAAAVESWPAAEGPEAAPAAAPLAPEMLAAIAPVLGATVEELLDVPADRVLAWLENPDLFEQERRGAGSPTVAAAEDPAPAIATADAPAADGPDTAAPLSPDLLAVIAASLGVTVADLAGASSGDLLAWLDNPEQYSTSQSGNTASVPAAPLADVPDITPAAAPDPPDADRDDDAIPLELLTAVAQVIGTTAAALRGASELQLMAWFQDPDSFPGPRGAAQPDAVAAPERQSAALAAPPAADEDSGPASPAEVTGAVRAVLPDDPLAFGDEYPFMGTTAARFRHLREKTARERLGDRPDVLNPLLDRMRELEQYEDEVKAQGVPSSGAGAPQPGSGPRKASAGSSAVTPPRTAALSSGGRDHDRHAPSKPAKGNKSLLGAVGNWLGGLFGSSSPPKGGKGRK